MFKRIIACFLVIVIIFSFAFSLTSYAIFPDIVRFAVLNFGDVIFSDHLDFTEYTAWLLDGRSGADACPSDPDGGAHVWTSDIALGTFTGYFNEHCMLCGITAVNYLSELEAEKCEELDSPTISNYDTGYTVAFGLPESTLTCLDGHVTGNYVTNYTYEPNTLDFEHGFCAWVSYSWMPMPEGCGCINTWYSEKFIPPEDGSYAITIPEVELKVYLQSGLSGSQKVYTLQRYYNGSWTDVSSFYASCSSVYSNYHYTVTIAETTAKLSVAAGYPHRIKFAFSSAWSGLGSSAVLAGYKGYCHLDNATITSTNGTTVVPATTRTGSLMQTINNYNVDNSVVDNSSNVNYYISPKSYVTELTDDTIDIEQCYSPQSYDEKTLVFTEPVTGAQYLTTGWTYDYTTRTYDIDVASGTITDGDTIDVTRIELIYGDEAVTYNYYLADDTLVQSDEYSYVVVSGDESFGTGSDMDDSGEVHEHKYSDEVTTAPTCTSYGWRTYTCECGDSYTKRMEPSDDHVYTDNITTEATCEAPGLRTYICSECGDSYTEKIAAAGHTWTVKQSVATEYDDTGAVTVQGYTIYKCSVCNTEYKDEAGTGPPNNSADSTDDTEGIFKKIGKLIASILAGFLDMMESVFGGILDGLTSLADMLGEKLTAVVDTVMSLFEKIPQMFGGFTDLLGAVFPFIPEDIITILTFGVAALVFVGLLKLIIKR